MKATTLTMLGTGLLVGSFVIGCGGSSPPPVDDPESDESSEPGSSTPASPDVTGSSSSNTPDTPGEGPSPPKGSSGSGSKNSTGRTGPASGNGLTGNSKSPAAVGSTGDPIAPVDGGQRAPVDGGQPIPDDDAGQPAPPAAAQSYAPLFAAPKDGFTRTPDELDGVWGASWSDVAGTLYDVRIAFTDDDMMFANRCTFTDNSSVMAGVDVAIRVSDSTISILQGDSDHEWFGTQPCSVSVAVGDMPYSVKNLDLKLPTLSVAATFTKIHD